MTSPGGEASFGPRPDQGAEQTDRPVLEPRQEPRFAPGERTNAQILADYAPEQQQIIAQRLKALSGIGYHIGRDMQMKIGLSEPGSSLWYQDPVKNEIHAEPDQLLTKDMEYLRFAMAHEGGHRRITRNTGIDPATMRAPGFAGLLNAVEDPRDNNFILEGYPVLRANIQHIYEHELGFIQAGDEAVTAKLGRQPRFHQADCEYIRQWMRDQQGLPIEIDSTLPPDVQAVVGATIEAAQDRWWTYPSKAEADADEANIEQYARLANNIILEKIWPEYQKLVEADIVDQKVADLLEEILRQQQEQQPQSMADMGLSPEQQQELEAAVSNAIDQAAQSDANSPSQSDINGSGQDGQITIDPTSLSQDLQDKLADYINNLPQAEQDERHSQASQKIAAAEQEAIKAHEGIEDGHFESTVGHAQPEMQDSPEGEESAAGKGEELQPEQVNPQAQAEPNAEQQARLQKIRDTIERLSASESAYDQARAEVQPIIDRVTNELESVFIDRRANRWTGGHRRGKRLDVARRMREKGKGLSAAESRAWERREQPTEKDYAFMILVDLSGCMAGGVRRDGREYSYDEDAPTKIGETFKSVIVVSEVLDRLKVPHEIVGFNSQLHDYKSFDQNLDGQLRTKMGGMLREVHSRAAGCNDDGWAVMEASGRLASRQADEKYLIVLSDGQPAESSAHLPHSSRWRGNTDGPDYDLKTVVEGVLRNTNQNLIGLGIQSNAVKDYYPTGLVEEDAAKLSVEFANLIKDIIENPGKYEVQ